MTRKLRVEVQNALGYVFITSLILAPFVESIWLMIGLMITAFGSRHLVLKYGRKD